MLLNVAGVGEGVCAAAPGTNRPASPTVRLAVLNRKIRRIELMFIVIERFPKARSALQFRFEQRRVNKGLLAYIEEYYTIGCYGFKEKSKKE
jgi:hypothetical protein